MVNRSLLRLVPIVLLSIFPIVGQVEPVRSEDVVKSGENDRIEQLVQRLRTGVGVGLGGPGFEMGELARLGKRNPSVVSALIGLLKESNPRVRSEAIVTLGFLEESAQAAIPDLLPFLEDTDPSIGIDTAQALARIGELAPALSRLTALLTHPTPNIRKSAAVALGYLGPSAKSSSPTLMLLLQDSDRSVRDGAMEALVNMGEVPKSIVTEMILMIKQPDPYDSYQIISRLEHLGESAIPELLPLLKDSSPDVRLKASRVLGSMMGKSVIPDLVPLLQDRSPKVRRSVIESLGQMRESGRSAVSDLIPLLNDSDTAIRGSAATALGEIGESAQSAVPLLILLLKDPSASVRSSGAGALGKMGESAKPAIPALTRLGATLI